MLQEEKSRKDIAKIIDVSTSTTSLELRKNCDMRIGTYNYDLSQRKYVMKKEDTSLIVWIKNAIQ